MEHKNYEIVINEGKPSGAVLFKNVHISKKETKQIVGYFNIEIALADITQYHLDDVYINKRCFEHVCAIIDENKEKIKIAEKISLLNNVRLYGETLERGQKI